MKRGGTIKRSPMRKRRRRGKPGDNRPHREWIASLPCVVAPCRGRSIAHHHRTASNSGTGLKPADSWCVPLCQPHHLELHSIGSAAFCVRYAVDIGDIAERLAQSSPYL